MTRGYALVLTLLVLAAAWIAGWYSTTRVVYFAPALLEQPSGCEWGDGEEPVISDFERDWFGGELRAFEEPSLYLTSENPPSGHQRTVRLTLIRSFHDPVVVRIEQRGDGSAILTAKQRPGGQGFGRPLASRRIERPLTASETAELESVLASTQVLDQDGKDCFAGVDGANWIVEAAEVGGRYIYVQRWTPRKGAVRKFGEFMLSLTGWNLDPVY